MRRCSPALQTFVSPYIASGSSALQVLLSTTVSPADSSHCSSSQAETGGLSAQQASRLESSLHCSTSNHSSQQPSWAHRLQQVRGYAKAAGGKKVAQAAKPAVEAAAVPGPDDLSPPAFKIKHVPRVYKGDPVAQLTPAQKALLEEVSPTGAPLRSLRALNWDLGPQETLALMHQQLSDVSGTNVQMVPLMIPEEFQSAAGLAAFVKDYVEDNKGMPKVEQAMLTQIARMSPSEVPFEGIKIQLKGRMSGKGGMASKKVWVWGRTGRKAHDDPVDFAHEAVVTRAGYIGIKVWVKYKRSHMPAQSYRISKPSVGVADLLAMPLPASLPSRSSSAWWNQPVTRQPQQHQAWSCFKQGYDPLTGTWDRQQQQQQTSSESSSPAAAAVRDNDVAGLL